MDNLLNDLAFFNDLQDEPIDPELQGAIKQYNSSPIRITKQKKTNIEKYKVLTSDEIVQYVVDFVREVNCILQLKSTVTRMLLSHCKWDQSLLMEKFCMDPEKLFKEARVINPFDISINDTIAESESIECEICYAELTSDSTASNACGHRFCRICWSEYLKVKIMDEGVGNSILCAATDCDVIIDDETVIELVDDLQAKRRYQHLITNSFVQKNLLLRWCPARGCSFAVKVDSSPFKPIACVCKCGHEFCFDCIEDWHGPVPCDVLKRFNAHLQEGFFNPRYLRFMDYRGADDRIKTCPNPNCTVSIQKIFGCHVMQCKNCSTIFCWECLNRYKTKAGVYEHSCKGETESKDVPKSTATKDSDDMPPQKYVKLSTLAEQHRDADAESLGGASNSLRKHEAPPNRKDQGSREEKKIQTLQPETDAEKQTHRGGVENGFLGFEQTNERVVPFQDEVPVGQHAALQPQMDVKQQTQGDERAQIAALEAEFNVKPNQALGDGRENDFLGFEQNEYRHFDVFPLERRPALQPQIDVKQQVPQAEEENDLFGFEQMNEYLRARHGVVRRFAYGRNEFAGVNRAIHQRQPNREALLIQGERNRRRILPAPLELNGDYAGPATRTYAYYAKYTAEDTHLKAAVTHYTQIKKALKFIHDKSENLVQFESALALLAQCRQTLKYSAIFAMYLKNFEKSLLFKNLYLDLEKATTELANSTALINVYVSGTHTYIPESVMPAHRNCILRRRALLDYIDEGYDNEWWLFEDRPT